MKYWLATSMFFEFPVKLSRFCRNFAFGISFIGRRRLNTPSVLLDLSWMFVKNHSLYFSKVVSGQNQYSSLILFHLCNWSIFIENQNAPSKSICCLNINKTVWMISLFLPAFKPLCVQSCTSSMFFFYSFKQNFLDMGLENLFFTRKRQNLLKQNPNERNE